MLIPLMHREKPRLLEVLQLTENDQPGIVFAGIGVHTVLELGGARDPLGT